MEPAEELVEEEEEKRVEPAEELVEEEEEEEEEEEISVSRFTHCGTTYLRTDENVLYDEETQEPVGIWDQDTETVKQIKQESEEEEEEE